MADLPDQTPPAVPAIPVQQPVREVIAPLRTFREPLIAVASRTPGQQLQQPQQPVRSQPVAPQASQPVYVEQVIEIAPHPTTNRFPWAPVENPHVAVMVEQPNEPAAPPPTAQPVLPSYEQPTLPPPPPAQPVATPVIPVDAPPAPEPPQQPAQPELPIPAPMPAPPAVEPPVTPAVPMPQPPVAPPASIVSESKSEPKPEPKAEPIPEVTPSPTPAAVPAPQAKPMRIYSQSTREVWHVFRPNKLVRWLFIGCASVVIIGLIAFWFMNGASTRIDQLPIVKSLMQAK